MIAYSTVTGGWAVTLAPGNLLADGDYEVAVTATAAGVSPRATNASVARTFSACAMLPFTLTAGQERAIADIDADLARRQLGYGRGGRQKIETDPKQPRLRTVRAVGYRWEG